MAQASPEILDIINVKALLGYDGFGDSGSESGGTTVGLQIAWHDAFVNRPTVAARTQRSCTQRKPPP